MLRSSYFWLHGQAARSHSVLAALLRIRQQYQRPSHPINRRDASLQVISPSRDLSVSFPQERQQLVDEAMKILRKEVRGGDTLSDVDAASAAFCVEVGKLLSVAAAFGAATTTPRVAEALQWVRANKKQLVSTRQVMSICVPLLNLKDGKTAGRCFVIEELGGPLLQALESPASPTVSSESDLKQHRSAIVSVFSLVGRLLESDGGDADEGKKVMGEESVLPVPPVEDCLMAYQRALLFFTKAVDALLLLAEQSLPPLEISECVYILQACQRLERDSEGKSMEEVRAGLNRVRPMIDAALGPSTAGTTKRPGDVCQLLSVASKLQDTNHMADLSRAALGLLPLALASATAKDICAALQVLVRLSGSSPEVTEPLLLRRVLEAVRPKLFLIAETHPASMRHVECSLLMSTLSRLEEGLPDDLVNLLSGCFAASMDLVQPAQLIPFLQGLYRCSEAASRSSADTHNVPFWEVARLPSVRPCIEQAADRVIAWAGADAITDFESAQLLLLFSQLRYTRVLAVYVALEKKLVLTVDHLSRDLSNDESNGNVAEGSSNISSSRIGSGDDDVAGHVVGGDDGSPELKQKSLAVTNGINLKSALMNALYAFQNEAVTVAREEEECLQRAGELYETLRQGAVESLTRTRNPKAFVMLLHLLMPEGKRGRGGGGSATLESDVATASVVTSSSRPLDAVAAQVCFLAPVSNAYEVGAIAKVVGEFVAHEFIGEEGAQRAMEAILERSEAVELSLYDVQSLLEGMRRVRVVSIPPSLIYRLATLLQNTPKKTTMMLRRLLPVLKTITMKPTLQEALIKLTEVAMANACTIMSTNASLPPPLRDTALLAHVLAQLYDLSSEPLVLNLVTKEEMGMTEEAEEETKEDENVEGEADFLEDSAADEPDEFIHHQHHHLLTVTKKAFLALGDVACSSLQQHVDSADGLTCTQISPQEIVMLVQSFEKVGVRHHAFLYEVVPLVRDMSGSMEPLELSLLLNAFARLGAWNGRVLNTLATNVAAQIKTCSLKQCQSILQALQSSGFLRPGAFLSTTEYKTTLLRDWRPACTPTTQASIDPLVVLATSVVERMTTLVERPESVSAILESQSLEDVAAVVRVLGFFDQPPQPAFDTYFEMAMKKFLRDSKYIMDESSQVRQKKWLMVALSLKGHLGKLRRYQRQCISAQTMADSITAHETALLLLTPGMRLMPEEKVADLYYTCCVFAMLYNVKFSPEAALTLLQVISEKLREEDVARNPRRVSSALRHLTKISCKHIGAPGIVLKIALDSAWHLVAQLQGNAGEEKDCSSPACSSSAAAVMMEVLCMSHLFALPYLVEEQQKLQQVLFFFSNHLRKNDVSRLSAAEGSILVLSTAVGTAIQNHCQVSVAWLDEVQRGILLNEKNLSVHDAVNILLAGALCCDESIVQAETVRCASRVLVGQMGKTDWTGLRLLPELYRLVTAGDACFMAWCKRLQQVAGDDTTAPVAGGVSEVFERVLPALLRALRSAEKGTTPTLCWQCRVDVAEQYQRCAKTYGDEQGLTDALAELVKKETCASP
ncbi:hypothetical protein MOQ_003695 [Trypanosoma cruzi marinkellei]|uniref:Uncharacterized protein n=1 Tax=Trypanosoma cruzi marinkellei TaxID=85056 RepID=K2NC52_TRYCR|nr:hypothetical protein MOQ_003695 [Trypanosoma cruzi marinkellei]